MNFKQNKYIYLLFCYNLSSCYMYKDLNKALVVHGYIV